MPIEIGLDAVSYDAARNSIILSGTRTTQHQLGYQHAPFRRVFIRTPEQIAAVEASHTGRYLRPLLQQPVPEAALAG